MKNLIKISLIAVLLINSAHLYAGEGVFSFRLKHVEDKSVTFFINETQVVHVALYDSENAVIYEKKINAVKGSTKTYDLNALPDGTYIFKLESEAKTANYKIQINNGRATVSEPLIAKLVEPVLTKKDEIITLNFENAPEGPLEVQILDGNQEPVFNRVFEGDPKFTRKFDVARMDISALTFVIKSANQVFTKTVQMD